jgi:hypothetical protein
VSPPQNNEYPVYQHEHEHTMYSLLSRKEIFLAMEHRLERGWEMRSIVFLTRMGHTGVVITNRIFIGRIGDLGREDNGHDNTYT